MEHLYLPPSLRYFVPLRVERGGPGAHACFEYDLVAAKRPEMVVDLGSGEAMSFSVFCQSMRDHDIDGLAYAIDTWGDDAPGGGEGTWATVNNFSHSNFRGFAYLLKQTPEQALLHFADRSVDVLRIDFGRLDRPLLPLLDAWMPKLKAGSVVLCAGLSARPDLSESWKRHVPSGLLFPGDCSLGVSVHEPSSAASPDFPPLSSQNDDADRDGWIAFYEHAALHHALRVEITGHAGALYRRKGTP